MIESYIIAIGGIVSLMIIWTVVQSFWKLFFSDQLSDEDVLAGRNSCGNCGCTTLCNTKKHSLNTKNR